MNAEKKRGKFWAPVKIKKLNKKPGLAVTWSVRHDINYDIIYFKALLHLYGMVCNQIDSPLRAIQTVYQKKKVKHAAR